MYGSDVYYHPEKYDLVQIGEVDDESSRDDWGFDMFVVWMDSSFKLYYASDAGCSCPSPFESYGKDDLTQATVQEVHHALDDWNTGGNDAQVADLHAKLATL